MDPSYTPELFYAQLPLLLAASDQVYLYRPFEPHLRAAGVDPGLIEQAVTRGWVVPVFRRRWFDEGFRGAHRHALYHRPISAFDARLRDHPATVLVDEALYERGVVLAREFFDANRPLIVKVVDLTRSFALLQQLYEDDRAMSDEDVALMTLHRFVNDAQLLYMHATEAVPFVLPHWSEIYAFVANALCGGDSDRPAARGLLVRRQIVQQAQSGSDAHLDLETALRFRGAGLHRSLSDWMSANIAQLAHGEPDDNSNIPRLWEQARQQVSTMANRIEGGIELATVVLSSLGTAVFSLIGPITTMLASVGFTAFTWTVTQRKKQIGSWLIRRADPQNLAWAHFFVSQSTIKYRDERPNIACS
jgi:hypothetical protein